MLVTRKKSQSDTPKGRHHSKKLDGPPLNRGNKFQALATDEEGDVRSTAPGRRMSQKTQANPKGKASNSLNQFRQSAATRTEKSKKSGFENPMNPNVNARGRGNVNVNSRGKDKIMSNGGAVPQMESPTVNGRTGTTAIPVNVGYFQFGSQQLAPNVQSAAAHQTFNVGFLELSHIINNMWEWGQTLGMILCLNV
nr:hypothetical protein Iba_chr07bCG2410 [Ipomoea batatas]